MSDEWFRLRRIDDNARATMQGMMANPQYDTDDQDDIAIWSYRMAIKMEDARKEAMK